jgi:hypothetical protein
MKDFLASKYMNILSQYGAGTGAGGAGVFVQASFVNNVAADLTDANIHTVIQNMINVGALPEPVTPSHMALMIFLAEDVAVKDPALGIVMCEPNGDTAFGYHNFFTTNAGHNLAYSVIPGLQDACLTESCSSDVGCSLHLAETQEQRQTQVASHEYSEMVTDPELNAWFDATTGEENGDICNGEAGTVSFGSNTWTVQRMYSKHDDIATNGATTCILEAPNPIPKLSPGPAAGLSPAEHLRLMKPGSLDRLLPLPAVQYDANADAMRIDQEEMRLYAKRLSHPLPHTYLFANLPEFLRTMADAIK